MGKPPGDGEGIHRVLQALPDGPPMAELHPGLCVNRVHRGAGPVSRDDQEQVITGACTRTAGRRTGGRPVPLQGGKSHRRHITQEVLHTKEKGSGPHLNIPGSIISHSYHRH